MSGKELQLDLKTYSRFLESAPDAMVVIDHDGVIVAANSHVRTLFASEPSALIGQPIEILLPERLRDFHVTHRRTYLANPSPRPMGTGMELWALSQAGREFPVEISLSPIKLGNDTLITAAIRDISQRVEVERALRDAKEQAEQASESKSHFLAAAGHDLRQPLHAMRMYLSALHDAPAAEQRADLVARMERTTESLAEILDALLDIARLDMGQVQPQPASFPIDDLLQQQVADALPHARAKGLGIHCVASPLHVRTDPGLLARILGNLLSNAVRHTSHGRILVGCQRRGERLRIGVWDTGPGIPHEAEQRIFDEYVQLDNPERSRSNGLGLGLSIVRRLCKLLELPMQLRTHPGRGSMFAVEVPIVAPVHAAIAAVPGTGKSAAHGTRVLFIEDDPEVLEATSMILRLRGFEVHTANDGREALHHLTAQGLDPDVILSDFRLPGEENGAQVVIRVRRHLEREIPVVFMTGDTSEARIRETALTFCDVLRKPLDADQLSHALKQAIASSGVRPDG